VGIDWPALGTFLTAIVGVVIALDARKTARERTAERSANNADAGESAAESVRLLLDPLNTRISTLESQLTAFAHREQVLKDEREAREKAHKAEIDGLRTVMSVMQSEINEFRGGVDVLLAQMEGAGIIPRWKPKPKTGPLGGKV
jgi:hypothetical protein